MHKTSDIAHLSYNHLELNTLFVSIAAFLNVIDTLFHKLSELEYVGLIKENIIISEITMARPLRVSASHGRCGINRYT